MLTSTSSGKVYALTGYVGSLVLDQYYPVVAHPPSAVTKVAVFGRILSNIILAGLNSSNKNVMTLFNTSDDSEIQLIGPDNEIEVYHVNYVTADNKIMFDGLRFSDNKYVLGQIDLSSMQVTVSQIGSTKLEDFQTF